MISESLSPVISTFYYTQTHRTSPPPPHTVPSLRDELVTGASEGRNAGAGADHDVRRRIVEVDASSFHPHVHFVAAFQLRHVGGAKAGAPLMQSRLVPEEKRKNHTTAEIAFYFPLSTRQFELNFGFLLKFHASKLSSCCCFHFRVGFSLNTLLLLLLFSDSTEEFTTPDVVIW